jgi:transposase
MENLTDRQAADAVRSRLDWKYAATVSPYLTPALTTPSGAEFRTRLVALAAEERLLEAVGAVCKQQGWLKGHGQQRYFLDPCPGQDSRAQPSRMRGRNPAPRIEYPVRRHPRLAPKPCPAGLVGALWTTRKSSFGFPQKKTSVTSSSTKWARMGGGCSQPSPPTLTASGCSRSRQWMPMLRIWKQDYWPPEQGGSWMAEQDRLEAARLFFSPYDLDASAAKKRSTYWIGYTVHFTETCDEGRPHLITHVVTNIGPIPDRDELPAIHAALQHQALLPHHHLVDAGYVDAEALVTSQTEYHVDLVGPTAQDHRGPAREQTGYALSDFVIDWEHEQARCPQGQISSSWTPKRHAESGSDQDQVWLCYLWSLSRAHALHPIQAADPDCAQARSPCCLGGCTPTRADPRIC